MESLITKSLELLTKLFVNMAVVGKDGSKLISQVIQIIQIKLIAGKASHSFENSIDRHLRTSSESMQFACV